MRHISNERRHESVAEEKERQRQRVKEKETDRERERVVSSPDKVQLS